MRRRSHLGEADGSPGRGGADRHRRAEHHGRVDRHGHEERHGRARGTAMKARAGRSTPFVRVGHGIPCPTWPHEALRDMEPLFHIAQPRPVRRNLTDTPPQTTAPAPKSATITRCPPIPLIPPTPPHRTPRASAPVPAAGSSHLPRSRRAVPAAAPARSPRRPPILRRPHRSPPTPPPCAPGCGPHASSAASPPVTSPQTPDSGSITSKCVPPGSSTIRAVPGPFAAT